MARPARISTSGPTISAAGYDVSPLSGGEVMDLVRSLNSEERRVLLDHGEHARSFVCPRSNLAVEGRF